jgi:transposase InsO family protein
VLPRSIEPSQYRSADFARFCQASGIATSTGRTGVCWDNAAAESFFGALKNEMYYRQAFPDCAARSAVADYIEVFYNRRRLHSTLGYRTPPKPSPATGPQQPLHDQPRGTVQDR